MIKSALPGRLYRVFEHYKRDEWERYLAAVKRVTPADLQRVAREYLTLENRSLYALLPAGTAPKSFDSTQA